MSKSLVPRLFYAEKRKSRLVSGSFQMKKWRFHQVSGCFYSEKWKSHPVSGFSPLFEEKTGAFVITFKKRNGSEGLIEGISEGLNPKHEAQNSKQIQKFKIQNKKILPPEAVVFVLIICTLVIWICFVFRILGFVLALE